MNEHVPRRERSSFSFLPPSFSLASSSLSYRCRVQSSERGFEDRTAGKRRRRSEGRKEGKERKKEGRGESDRHCSAVDNGESYLRKPRIKRNTSHKGENESRGRRLSALPLLWNRRRQQQQHHRRRNWVWCMRRRQHRMYPVSVFFSYVCVDRK